MNHLSTNDPSSIWPLSEVTALPNDPLYLAAIQLILSTWKLIIEYSKLTHEHSKLNNE